MLCIHLTGWSGYNYAYDGDVDFSAPYLTVDPETGKLITVDPTKEPAPPLHTGAQFTPSPQSIASESTNPMQTADPEIQALPVNMIIAGTVIVVLILAVAILTARRKQSQLSTASKLD